MPGPEPSIVHLTESFDAPPARVFEALTSPRDLEAWIWGGMGTDDRAEVDLRVGGAWRAETTVEDAGTWPTKCLAMHGYFVHIDPPRRLVYTLRWDAPVGYNEQGDVPLDETVTVELTARADGGTDLEYTHLGVPDAEAAAEHAKAIKYTFGMLRDRITP